MFPTFGMCGVVFCKLCHTVVLTAASGSWRVPVKHPPYRNRRSESCVLLELLGFYSDSTGNIYWTSSCWVWYSGSISLGSSPLHLNVPHILKKICTILQHCPESQTQEVEFPEVIRKIIMFWECGSSYFPLPKGPECSSSVFSFSYASSMSSRKIGPRAAAQGGQKSQFYHRS